VKSIDEHMMKYRRHCFVSGESDIDGGNRAIGAGMIEEVKGIVEQTECATLELGF